MGTSHTNLVFQNTNANNSTQEYHSIQHNQPLRRDSGSSMNRCWFFLVELASSQDQVEVQPIEWILKSAERIQFPPSSFGSRFLERSRNHRTQKSSNHFQSATKCWACLFNSEFPILYGSEVWASGDRSSQGFVFGKFLLQGSIEFSRLLIWNRNDQPAGMYRSSHPLVTDGCLV